MNAMSETWEEKLVKTERVHQERQQALEKMGISVQASGIQVEKNKFYLVNLNADPSLNELLVYYLKVNIPRGSMPRLDFVSSSIFTLCYFIRTRNVLWLDETTPKRNLIYNFLVLESKPSIANCWLRMDSCLWSRFVVQPVSSMVHLSFLEFYYATEIVSYGETTTSSGSIARGLARLAKS